MTFLEKTKRFLEPIKTHPNIYWEGLFVSFLSWVNGVAHVFFLERIMYYLTQEPDSFYAILFSYGVFLISFEVVNFLVRKWGWVKIEWTTSSYASSKYLRLFAQMDNNYVESLGTGKLMTIVQDWIDRWGLLLWQAIEIFGRLVVAIAFTIYVISQIQSLYIGLFIVLFFSFFVLSRYFNNQLFPFRKLRQFNRIDISRATIKVFMSKNEILQNNSIEKHNAEIAIFYKKDIKINQDMWTMRTLLLRNTPFIISISLFVIYYTMGWGFLDNTIPLHVLVGLTGSIIVIQRIVMESLYSYIDFTKEFVKIITLWEIFDNAPIIHGYNQWASFTPQNKDIILKNISYGYNETKVFDTFSLTIKRWKKTALVWASGGGKTTLMKLIAGYLHPDSGTISVLGNNLSSTALRTYYPHIGYLTQEPSVFDGTIRENLISAIADKKTDTGTDTHKNLPLSFSERESIPERSSQSEDDKNATTVSSVSVSQDEMLDKALRLAHCDFVFELEHGLDTEIGERWVRLSWGQKQRLAIAKIFLKDPEIILLDEPTSALDSFSEEQITRALDELFIGRTVVIIAHRLQTVRKADDIIVIENGQVIERGDHNELVSKDGVYKKMLDLQSGF